MSLYGEDLARIHDAAYGAVAEAAARHVLEWAPTGRSLDLGCGGGIFSEILADRGWDVQGLDISEAMVQAARRRAPTGTFWVADVAEAPLPEVDVVSATGEVLNYACPDLASLRHVFSRVREALPVGGVFLFDLAVSGRAQEPYEVSREGAGWRIHARSCATGDRLTRTIDTWWTEDGVERHGREVHEQTLFDPGAVLHALEEAGFAAQPLGGYDDLPFEAGWDGFEARAA